MTRRKTWKDSRAKRESGPFVALPHAVLKSDAFLALSPYAIKLLLDLALQYRSDNNGDLSAAWKLMKARGWRSEETLNKAKKELLAVGLIAETRKGGRPNRTTLYGLTYYTLDPDPKLDVKVVSFPQGAWKRWLKAAEPDP